MEIKDNIKFFTLLSQIKKEKLKKSLTKVYIQSIANNTIGDSLQKNICSTLTNSFYNVSKKKYV